MQHHFISCLSMLTLLFFACQNERKPTLEAKDAQAASPGDTVAATTAAIVFQLDPAASILRWEGYEGLKLGKSEHNGTLGIKSGSLDVQGKLPVGGKFEMDIASLKVEDIPSEKPSHAKLTRNLLGADFFEADKFPTAAFEITGATPLMADSVSITGNLTLKGITKSITFPALVQVTDSSFTATTPKFYINRKDWGMHYRSDESLGDELIRHELGISLHIAARK